MLANQAPSGADRTVTTLEDTAYTFAAADFGFTDPSDSPANNLLAVQITMLPNRGTLMDNGVTVTANQYIPVADIMAGLLKFMPATNATGSNYARLRFKVQDDGGTAGGGVNLDPTPNRITFNVTAVNDAPSGANRTITTLEDTAYTFTAADFGFADATDSPANTLLAVKITSLPTAGTLANNGVAVTAGQSITLANINSGLLKFTAAANANGLNYASLTFQVQDNGGIANGGVDLDQTPNTITFNVTSINDAPSGTNTTVTTLEDTAYTFTAADFGFSDTTDTPSNNLLSVRISTLPLIGRLTNNGSNVSAGGTITLANITAGLFRFTPAANANGAGSASFTFQVRDNGGTANGGIDLDATPNTITFNVTSINDAPSGTNTTVTTLEDTDYTFTAADFGFSDAADSPANSLLAVKITTLPAKGTLRDNGVAVTAGQLVSVADVMAGLLTFTPAVNAIGSNYTSFTFQVQDDGGTASGGVDLDPTANTITFNVTAVNDAPSGANKTITTLEDTAYTFTVADFGFSDASDSPANNFLAVRFSGLPTAGTLTAAGVAVTAGQFVSASNIAAGLLKFVPVPNANGISYATIAFQVQDNGGTANGGVDLDPTAKTITVDVTPVNDPPSGTDNTVTTVEGSAYTFTTADFGFIDPDDSPANNLQAVRISSLPTAGRFTWNGVTVAAGQFISAADIAAGKLKFTPSADTYGLAYASFRFQVQDDGGTANGGVNLDPTPNTITINVTSLVDVWLEKRRTLF